MTRLQWFLVAIALGVLLGSAIAGMLGVGT
jgi:hypothetical protein